MKLSELSTDKALDVLCELTPHIKNITDDEAATSSIGKVLDDGQGLNLYGRFMLLAGWVGDFIPVLLRTHRADVYGILSVMNERPVEEIASQKLIDTMAQVRELFQDEDFVSFFKSSAQQDQSIPSAPSAPSPASE